MTQENSSTNVDFASRLQQLLILHGMSKSQLAEKVGVSPTAIGNYCTDRIPKAEELLRIAKTFQVSMEWLLTGENPLYVQGNHEPVYIEKDDEGDLGLRVKTPNTHSETMSEAFSLMRQALEKLEEVVTKGLVE